MKAMMTIFSLFVFLLAQGQDLKAFRQEVNGGAMKTFVDEHGQEYRSAERETLTYIYLRASKRPQFRQLWVDGERFEFTVTEVPAPVVIKKQLTLPPAVDTLMTARTSEKVFKIIPGRKLGDGHRDHKGVILVTKWRNYITEEITILDPAFPQ